MTYKDDQDIGVVRGFSIPYRLLHFLKDRATKFHCSVNSIVVDLIRHEYDLEQSGQQGVWTPPAPKKDRITKKKGVTDENMDD